MAIVKNNGSNKITIAVTGTAISLNVPYLPSTQSANRVDIQAFSGNAKSVFIGDSTVQNSLVNGGIELKAGDVYNIELITDISKIYVNGTAGDSIGYNWWIGDRN